MTHRRALVGARRHLLRSRHDDPDVRERLDGVAVTARHDVRKANVVEGGRVAGLDAHEQRLRTKNCLCLARQKKNIAKKMHLLDQVHVLNHAQREVVVAELAVEAEQADDREKAEHLVEWPRAVLADGRGRVGVRARRNQVLLDARLVDQRVQHVDHAEDVPELEREGGGVSKTAHANTARTLRHSLRRCTSASLRAARRERYSQKDWNW